MALMKSVTSPNGVVTNYHRIDHVDLTDNQLHCRLVSYVSRDYRDADKSVKSDLFSFNFTVEEEESMGIRALCYSKIKNIEEWSDAEDC